MSALLATTAVLQIGPAKAAPADIFASAAPSLGSPAAKAADLRTGDASVSTQTGALQYGYPIQVPPGRGGMAPQLALSYSSQAPTYGGIAAGWALAIPEIREDTSQGRLATHSPKYEQYEADPKADDRFSSSMAGGRPLIKVSEAIGAGVYGAYRAQNDTSFARYERMQPGQTSMWRVRTLDGSTMYFGEPTRTVGCTNVSEGYAPLTSVVDAFGNSVFYEYESVITHECRLQRITWGENPTVSLTPFAKVDFTWNTGTRCVESESSYKGGHLDFRTGTKILTGASKLLSIKATAFPFGGEAAPVHTRLITLGYFDLDNQSYANTESCGASHAPVRLLRTIQESAWGIDSPQVDLPPITFTYGSPAINLNTSTAPSSPTPWNDGGPPFPWSKRENLGWGSRPPSGAPDKWPTVEAMMVDLDGDGLLDRLYANSKATETGECQASWQRNKGPTLGATSTLPMFDGPRTFTLPRLRWRGSSTPVPSKGALAAHDATPNFESCSLNGQATAYRNVLSNSIVFCHDGSNCQFSSTPGLTTQQFCYAPGEFGLDCPPTGTVTGTYRTYLAYRWFDADGDGLTDLVTAIQGDIRAYDIIRGNDTTQDPDEEPFGIWPACPTDLDYCKQIDKDCVDKAANWTAINACIAAAPSTPCGGLATSTYMMPGQPPQAGMQRTPYRRCEGRYPWMIYKNQGNGILATSPVIKYSPIELESEAGDSNLSGPTIMSRGHGIFDFDGDGRPDAVKLDESRNVWQVWLGDGTGGFGPRRHDIVRMPFPSNKIAAVGGGSSWGGSCQSSVGLVDVNGDGLSEHWRLLEPAGNASLAWHDGTGYVTAQDPVTGNWTGGVATPLTDYPVKPGADVRFTSTDPVNPNNTPILAGETQSRNVVVDVDNDGRVDVVNLETTYPTVSTPKVHFNAGGQFLQIAKDYPGDTNGLKRKVIALSEQSDSTRPWEISADLIDLDGDGIPESAYFPNAGANIERREHNAGTDPPRLMTVIENGRGASTRVAYASMHDKTTVEQHPELTWSDSLPNAVRPKASPHNQWVVRQIATTDALSATSSTTSQFYKNPRHAPDDQGRFSFRGFEEVTTTAPTSAKTVQLYDYALDWSGRLVETRVHPAEAIGEVRSIDRTQWKDRSLFGGAITTYHVSWSEHLTCANGQTVATCTPAAAPGYTRTVVEQAAFGVSGEPSVLWADTETILQAAPTLADGDRRTITTFALQADPIKYRFRPLVTTREHRVTGAFVMFGKTAKTWDAELRVPLTDEVWIDSVDANRAITRLVYDLDTGNLIQRWKPIQNAANTVYSSFGYDDRKLFVGIETNELGHQVDHQYEYGTGTKLRTDGPNTRTCTTGCPPTGPDYPVKEQHKIRVDGLGRTIASWDTVSDDGDIYTLYQRSTASFVDAYVGTTPPSVTQQTRLTTSPTSLWTQERTDLDGHGRPIKKTVFAQGSAAADQVTTFTYRADGTLQFVAVPDPTQNNASVVSYEYGFDSLGRATSIRRPDSTTPGNRSGVNISYDGVIQTTTEVVLAGDGVAAASKTLSDRFGRLVQVQELSASPGTWTTTNYSYGPDDLVTSVIDPQAVTTTLTHDFAGRRTQITRHGRTWKYVYDKNGNLTSEQVPGSTNPPLTDLDYTTTITYDALDRPLQKLIGQRSLSTADQAAFGTRTETFEWDVGGNMLGQLRYWKTYAPSAPSAMITHSTRFDNQGQLITTVHTGTLAGYPAITRNFGQRFHLFGGLNETRYEDQLGGTNKSISTIAYDARALPTQMVLSRTGQTNQTLAVQTRNVAGLVTKRSNTSGTVTVESNWSYDTLGRTASQVVQKLPSTALVRQDLAYFGNDDPKLLTHYLGTASKQFTFAYDPRHQLTGVTTNVAGYFTGTYAYGTGGRFTRATEAQTISPLPAGTEVKPRDVNYVYGGADPEQVTALTNVSGGTTYASYAYDAAGNQTARCYGGPIATCTGQKTEYVYDGKDQLRRATKKLNGVVQGSEEYWYGGTGDRLAVVKRDAAGVKTEMIWFIGDVQAHYNGTGTLTQIFSHLSLGTPVARLKRTANATTELEYQFHGLASNTIAAVSQTGTVNASFSYTPFGSVVESTNAGGTANGTAIHRRRLNDKYLDEISDLAYYGARYYDKTLIGWTQADPLYLRLPDAAQMSSPRRANIHTFSLQNPLRYIDPDGLDPAGNLSSYKSEVESRNNQRRGLEADGDWMARRWELSFTESSGTSSFRGGRSYKRDICNGVTSLCQKGGDDTFEEQLDIFNQMLYTSAAEALVKAVSVGVGAAGFPYLGAAIYMSVDAKGDNDVAVPLTCAGSSGACSSLRNPKTLQQAVGKNAEGVVKNVLKGKVPLTSLTEVQRTQAATFYRGVASRTKGIFREKAASYSTARAEYLEGTRQTLSPTLPLFIKNGR